MIDAEELPEFPIPEQTESFLTSLGSLPHETATSVAANLANRSFIHAITGANPKNTPITENPTDTPKAEIGLTTPERQTTPEVLDTPEHQTTPERKLPLNTILPLTP